MRCQWSAERTCRQKINNGASIADWEIPALRGNLGLESNAATSLSRLIDRVRVVRN
jgi:hypothetical protein